MRKLSLIALLALCFAFPGIAEATTLNDTPITNVEQTGEIDPALVELIIRHLQQEYGYDYDCLCDQYESGEMTIEKSAEGYLVSFDDGSLGISVIIDNL